MSQSNLSPIRHQPSGQLAKNHQKSESRYHTALSSPCGPGPSSLVTNKIASGSKAHVVQFSEEVDNMLTSNEHSQPDSPGKEDRRKSVRLSWTERIALREEIKQLRQNKA